MHDVIRDRLLKRAGIGVEQPVPVALADLRETEWSPKFERLMRNRLIMGSFRYQRFEVKRKSFDYDCAHEAVVRIERYKQDGNTEHLVDAANMLLLEFEFGRHPRKHFASIDDGEHAQPINRKPTP